jgi:5-methylcytosine-specific restriction enzyme subunit McrC
VHTHDIEQIFSLTEYEEQIVEAIDSDIAEKILKTGIVEVSRKVSGEFVLKAESKVGFVAVQDIQVNINPRFPIYNIFYLLGLVDAIKLEKEKVIIEQNSDFLTILFQTFLQSVSETTRKGLLRDYVNLEEYSRVLKGRFDFGRQIKTHPGSYYPFAVVFDDFVEDIPENQILKWALQISLKYGLKKQRFRNVAQSLLLNFKDVSEINEMPLWNSTRLNQHYWDSMKLAALIVAGNGFSESVGSIEIHGFSIEMHKVFEDFVAKQLDSRIKNSSNYVLAQKRLALDTKGIYHERPDVIWYRNGKPFQVIDTKYKKPEGDSEKRDSMQDLRQVISYASLLGLKEAHLIYGVAGDVRSITTRQEGITVYSHGLDLGKSPTEINAQLDRIVERLNG